MQRNDLNQSSMSSFETNSSQSQQLSSRSMQNNIIQQQTSHLFSADSSFMPIQPNILYVDVANLDKNWYLPSVFTQQTPPANHLMRNSIWSPSPWATPAPQYFQTVVQTSSMLYNSDSVDNSRTETNKKKESHSSSSTNVYSPQPQRTPCTNYTTTPRPIRKVNSPLPAAKSEIRNDPVVSETYNEQPLHQKLEKNYEILKKRHGSNRKQSEESSLNSSITDSSSPSIICSPSQPRNLPLRSKNVDLSTFLLGNLNISKDEPLSGRSSKPKFGGCEVKCSFCENNGESEEIYKSHPLKDSLGKVVCPILRTYCCPKCGESGDYAHTNKYCPDTQRKQKESKIRKFCF